MTRKWALRPHICLYVLKAPNHLVDTPVGTAVVRVISMAAVVARVSSETWEGGENIFEIITEKTDHFLRILWTEMGLDWVLWLIVIWEARSFSE